jgi:hypothetical protein
MNIRSAGLPAALTVTGQAYIVSDSQNVQR